MLNRQRLPSLLSKSLLAGLILLCFAAVPHAPIAQDRGQGTKSKSEQRIALVIGNADYKESKLTNPVNDARDMAAALRGVGFEVLTGEDLSLREMEDKVRVFGQRLRQGGVGIFYYAGHGTQVNGANYLIPINADIQSPTDFKYKALEVGYVLGMMEEARNRLNVVILDACRNNPFRSFARSSSGGLAGITSAPGQIYISYATAANSTASDGSGRNGLFTGELLKQLSQPGQTLQQVFMNVRREVRRKTEGQQVPFEYSSVEEDFYFVPPKPSTTPADELTAWNFARRSRNASVVRLFLSDYPNSRYAAEARSLLAELEKSEKPTVGSNPPPVSSPTASKSAALIPVIPLPRGVAPTDLTIHRFTTASVDAKGKVTKFDGTPTQQYSQDLGGGVRLEMVAVKGGTLEREKVPVTVSNFWIGKFELTQAQWRAVMGTEPSKFKGDRLPVEQVSWEDAKEFCRRLNAKLGLRESEGYRLPTKDEWEYAARASSKAEFAFGETISTDIVNYDDSRVKPVEVGSLGVANGWGLFDMNGNVFEWCEDWDRQYPPGSRRYTLGGCWFTQAGFSKLSSNTHSSVPDFSNSCFGFRLARNIR
ncbi:MAG: caspase family protein [Acidobacteriota bacterium]